MFCTAGSHCLSILNVIVCIYKPQTPSPSHSIPPPPWQPEVCSLCLYHLCFYFYFFVVISLEPYLQHVELPRLGVKSELRPLSTATATTMQDLRCVCDLYHSSQQLQILNPLGAVRDRTCILIDAIWVR